MRQLSSIAPSLTLDQDGIWRAGQRSAIDYPDDANAFCFQLEDRSFWFNYRNRFILETVRNFPPAGPIVDIGAGNGYVSLALQRAGFEVVVIEPGAEGARNARSRGLDPVVCATLEDAGLQRESLDAVGLFDVVEHIRDDVAFLRTVRRALRHDGRLYLTVPAFGALWSSEDDLVGHHHRYTLREVAQRLGTAGFAVEYATYLFSPLLVPLYLFRSLPSRLGRRTELDPAQTAAELNPASGLAVRAVTKALDVELALVARRWRIPFGTSCLIAARAVPPSHHRGSRRTEAARPAV
jgi:SAM-dependent methyltransferase